MLLEIAHPSETFVHRLPTGGSSGAFSLFAFSVIVVASLQPNTSIVLNYFVSADLLFVLLINSYHINSHKLV